LQTAVSMMEGEYTNLIGEGAPVINVIQAAGIAEYSPVVCLILVSLAIQETAFEKPSDVKKADKSSPAIYLAYKVFFGCLHTQKSILCLEQILFLLQHIPVIAKANQENKTKLLFNDSSED